MQTFNESLRKVISDEGGYLLHTIKGDKGGETFAGITRKNFPGAGVWGLIDGGKPHDSDEVKASVADFYYKTYWQPLLCGELLDSGTADMLFSFAINMGSRTAVKRLQIAVHTKPDGVMGEVTKAAANTKAVQTRYCYALSIIGRYRDIIAANRTQKRFITGWLNRVLNKVGF
ncbi:putative peptidoglycan binding protein [Sinobacterium caligoides]|uniref:Putative peptidoglycan binding protein n=1 Tax=Sinobacterium caligoides TaxID=933926 RepID=A0A3N2E0S0_9GAMM|nr:glycosyl hydrolase 108 family protein [Sinobacterium caligoides]ROS05698.1 putative peptidoglycan binding protein [Sinobacterium caligoides]